VVVVVVGRVRELAGVCSELKVTVVVVVAVVMAVVVVVMVVMVVGGGGGCRDITHRAVEICTAQRWNVGTPLPNH